MLMVSSSCSLCENNEDEEQEGLVVDEMNK